MDKMLENLEAKVKTQEDPLIAKEEEHKAMDKMLENLEAKVNTQEDPLMIKHTQNRHYIDDRKTDTSNTNHNTSFPTAENSINFSGNILKTNRPGKKQRQKMRAKLGHTILKTKVITQTKTEVTDNLSSGIKKMDNKTDSNRVELDRNDSDCEVNLLLNADGLSKQDLENILDQISAEPDSGSSYAKNKENLKDQAIKDLQ